MALLSIGFMFGIFFTALVAVTYPEVRRKHGN